MRAFIVFLLLLGTVQAEEFATKTFMTKYCTDCHGDKKQKADRRFDQLTLPILDLDAMHAWQEVVDQLSVEEMPPDDEPMPNASERKQAIDTLTAEIAAARDKLKDSGGHTTLRRINKTEYRYTIEDVIGINTESWNPATAFPSEVEVGGFKTNGKALVTSGMLLDHYLNAASAILERSTHFGPRPENKTWKQASPFHYSNKDWKKRHADTPAMDVARQFTHDRFRQPRKEPFTELTSRFFRGGAAPFEPWAGVGAPHTGLYTIRIKASAHGLSHPYGQKAIDEYRIGDPLVLEVQAINRRGSSTETRSLAVEELTEPTPRWLSFDVHIQKGFSPEVRFRNGAVATKRLTRVVQKAAEHNEKLRQAMEAHKNDSKLAKNHAILNAYEGPRIRIFEIEISGPHTKQWPPAPHVNIYGSLQEGSSMEAAALQAWKFAESAFRRPVSKRELAPFIQLLNTAQRDGNSVIKAYQMTVRAILSAPQFTYLNEGRGQLNDFALASRLSYFLWCSAPDEELLSLAGGGQLRSPDVLDAQVERMLNDPRSERFIADFTHGWFAMDNVGQMPPSNDFRTFWRDNIGPAMTTETQLFFRHLLNENLPVSTFLNADYSFMNRELATHYGIEGIEGKEFQKVSFTTPNRGGILTQASFLTASANGVDTSPINRGIYVLDKIMGYHPPPPPEDVPEIEPDTRGTKTIRDQLRAHREVAACAQCHSKIDPLGFALENFNAIGQWRDTYPASTQENGSKKQSLPVDASGALPTGETFSGIGELRQLLIKQDQTFLRCLSEKLLTYATGRELSVLERPDVDKLSKPKASTLGLRDLVKAVVRSEPFLNN